MTLDTLYPHTPSFTDIRPTRQGRSKKILRMKVAHDGRVFIARFEGRSGFCFGLTEREATYNLRAGQ